MLHGINQGKKQSWGMNEDIVCCMSALCKGNSSKTSTNVTDVERRFQVNTPDID